MKRYLKLFPFFLLMGLLIAGCSLELPTSIADGEYTSLKYLPGDVANDEERVQEGEFEFKTLLPVTFRLTVSAYDLRGVTEVSARSLTPISRAPKGEEIHIVVVLTTLEKKTIYMGHISSEETLEFDAILPSAPQRLLLTLIADGFEPRTIVLDDPAQYSIIDRELAIGMTDKSIVEKKYKDTDKDFIPDQYDAFPLDPELAFVVQVPTDEPMTVTFEDLYPVPGDADYNDFNAAYWITEYYSSFGERMEIKGTVTARARGAGYNHRFGIRIFLGPDVNGTLEVNYRNENGDLIDTESVSVAETANITIFEETNKAFKRPVDYVTFDNAYPDKLYSKGYTTDFTITLTDNVVPNPKDPEWLPYSLPPYDPYIYVYTTKIHRDIHLIDMPKLDNSENEPWDPPDFRYDEGEYIGFPWCMILPIDWPYPVERKDIHDVYPYFQDWYQSNGSTNTDWYLKPVPELVITPEVPAPPYEPKTYESIYIETFHPEGPLEAPTDTRLELYKWGNATPIAVSHDMVWSFDDIEVADLVSGDILAIRVTGAGSGVSGGSYAIWVLDSTRLEAPDPPESATVFEPTDSDDATFPWDGGGSTPIELGEDIARYLFPNGADIDWFVIELP